MQFAFTPYSLPALFSSIVAIAIAAYLWPQRRRRGARALFGLTAASVIWSLFETIELCSIGLEAKYAVSNIRWIGVVSVPTLWLFFALQYAQTRPYNRWRFLAILFIMPAITITLYWTNPWHHLMRTEVWLDPDTPAFASSRGPWYTVHTLYSYACMILGTLVLSRFMLLQTRFYRTQVAAVITAALTPFVLNVIFQLRLFPLRYFDPTPSAMAISVVLLALSLYRYRFLDLVPIARQRVVDELPDAVFVLDHSGKIVDVNPAAAWLAKQAPKALLGLDPCKALGVTPEVLFHGENSPGPWDLKLTTPNGTPCWVDVRFSLLQDASGEESGQIIVLRDITARKGAEEKVYEREGYLEAVHHISDLLVDMSAGIPWAAIAAEIAGAARAIQAGALLAADPANPDTPFESAALWQRPDNAAVPVDLAYLLQPDSPERDELEEGHPVHHRKPQGGNLLLLPFHDGAGLRGVIWLEGNGEACWDQVAVAHLREAAARVSQALYRQRSQQEHQELSRQFERTQKLESLGVLAGGIAHDFNNLLSMILGNAELARKDLPDDSPGKRRLANVERAALSASKLCSQMLTYAGQGSRSSQRIDLNEVVLEVKELLASSTPKHVALEFHMGSKLPPIEGDAVQLQQILINFVTNATEALGKSAGVITVETGASFCTPEFLREAYMAPSGLPGWTAYLEVRDTACGMDPTTLARIFEPFYTTKFTGRGLGLSAVLGIVRSHGGGLHVVSEPGKGSTFRVFFRRLDTGGAQNANAATPKLRRTGERRFLLVVDDEQDVLNLTRHTLEQLGYNVITAASGAEAAEICRNREGEICCALIDLMMPGMDGPATCKALRHEVNHLPVVFASGLAEDTARTRYGDAMDGCLFLQKPFRARALLEALNEAMGNPSERA